jgi:type I restriction-modification system DNA methylase subunit
MNKDQARNLVRQTLTQSFDKARFRNFVLELLNDFDESKAFASKKTYIKDAFKPHVDRFERFGTYTSPEEEKLDVLVVHLTNESKLERARTAIRNFVADHLKQRDGKDAAFVAFVSPTENQWRFSYVKMEYATVEKDSGRIGVETKLTPARRFSYIVGEGESCHTAQTRFLDLLQDTDKNPTLAPIEEAFSVEAVTKEFFKKYAELFAEIQNALDKLAKKDPAIAKEFDKKNVRTADFAKKLMGQIVFLYFIQKKGWLGVEKGKDWGTGPHDFLRRLARGDYGQYENFFNNILEPLFYDTLATDRGHEAWCKRFNCRIPFLNGGLFEPLADYDWRETDIILPNRLFTNNEHFDDFSAGTGLLDMFDRYNFTVNEAEPLEKEVAIDPEMLGKVFENLIEENLRKGLGSYYTPREIVHYMCQESLVNYLDTALNTSSKSIGGEKRKQAEFGDEKVEQTLLTTPGRREIVPRIDIETFVHLGDQASFFEDARVSGTTSYARHLPKSIEKNSRLIDDKLAEITVCDPAVGSGAFPVGMMTEIVRARSALTPYFNDPHERSPYFFKRHAIQNCLYGVDIDPGAVEIAKLRLWLSLVVDEEDVKQIKPLPNLFYKIVAGDSLLNVDKNQLENWQSLHRLEELKPKFFDEPHGERKHAYKCEIDDLIHQLTNGHEKFDFEIYFSEVFHRKKGFDVVIANPPYLFITAIDPKQRDYLFSHYSTVAYRFDIYGVFIEKSLTQLLARGGTLTFINPHTLLSNDSFEKLRRLLLAQVQIKKVIDIGPGAFENASNEVMVFVACKILPRDGEAVHVFTTDADIFPKPVKQFEVAQKVWSKNPKASWLVNLSGIESEILMKMERTKYRLGDLCTINQGMRTGDNEKYLSANKKSRKWKPAVGGKDIGRYKPLPDGQFVYYEPSVIDAPRRPEIFESAEKLVIQEIRNITLPRRLVATYDNRQFYCLQSTNVINMKRGITQPSLPFLLGVLNSAAANFFFRCRFPGNNHIPSNQLSQIPVPTSVSEKQKSIERFVARILTAKQRDPEGDTTALEREIDQLVYALYGLTPKEIQIVEGAAK